MLVTYFMDNEIEQKPKFKTFDSEIAYDAWLDSVEAEHVLVVKVKQ
jgi:hypothetical protein